MNRHVKYSVIVPLYNEEEVVTESHKRLKKVMDDLKETYELVFVNDGSHDKTLEIMDKICEADKNSKLINFSRNFGHQIAISAGMDYAQGDAVIVIDADLQDPPEVIPSMIEKWKEGFQVVYGKRLKRKGETIFKKLTAGMFYRFLKSMTSVNIPLDVGDFRLIDRKVCDVMKNNISEKNRFVRGLISWIGFKQSSVEYVRDERWAGETKYPLKKMIKFAMDGITSFSYKPLKLATLFGSLASIAGFVFLIVIIVQKFIGIESVTGWSSTMCIILIFNGLTLLILGIIGEYIGRIYDELKNRPLYIIGSTIGIEEEKK